MKKYYIYHARGIFTESAEYAEKSQTEMIEDILASYPAFVQLADFDSEAEAEKHTANTAMIYQYGKMVTELS